MRTWNTGDERRAAEILKVHSGKDVHLHGLPDHGYVPDTSVLTVGVDVEQSTQIVDDGSGVFYVSGKMFSDRDSAQAYLDRQTYLDTLYHSTQTLDFDLDDALLDPATTFHSVKELMNLSCPDPVKRELLRRWAYDVKTLEVADDEGMTGPTSADLLQEIESAFARLHPAG